MATLILLRHGESIWNKKNLFTGWVDVPLSEKGIEEAFQAGRIISHMPIDIIFCSTLIRGIMTAMIAMSVHKDGKTPVIQHDEGKMHAWAEIYSEKTQEEIVPVYCADALNERMYGELQGLNKKETMQKFGEEQVKLWRRSYKVCPPHGESLEITTMRTIPYFEEVIVPQLKAGKNVFVSAHGNSLRACVKYIEGLTDDEVVSLEIATGVPIIYSFKENGFHKQHGT